MKLKYLEIIEKIYQEIDEGNELFFLCALKDICTAIYESKPLDVIEQLIRDEIKNFK